MLDEPTEVALAGWATDWGLPWPSTLQPNRTARWFARQIRDHALLWRRDPALPRRWLYLGIDGIAEPVSKDGAAGWSLTWRDGQPEMCAPTGGPRAGRRFHGRRRGRYAGLSRPPARPRCKHMSVGLIVAVPLEGSSPPPAYGVPRQGAGVIVLEHLRSRRRLSSQRRPC